MDSVSQLIELPPNTLLARQMRLPKPIFRPNYSTAIISQAVCMPHTAVIYAPNEAVDDGVVPDGRAIPTKLLGSFQLHCQDCME